MSKTWKWILGIFVVLVVIGGIVCATAFHLGFMRDGVVARGIFQPYGCYGFDQRSPMMGGDYDYYGPSPMMGGNYSFYGPSSFMRGHGFFPFFGGLIPLALLGLLVYVAYRYGKNKSNAQVSSVATGSAGLEEAPAAKAVQGHSCRKCGGMVQEDWQNCPYCGTKQ